MTQDNARGRHTTPDPMHEPMPPMSTRPGHAADLRQPAVDQPAPSVPPQVAGEPPLPPPADHDTGQSTTSTPVRRSRFGGIWVGLIVAALILVLLLIFILQNAKSVQIDFLWMSGNAPVAVAILLGVTAGALLVAIPGTVRIMQLRKTARHRH